jgi:hypothetical protein
MSHAIDGSNPLLDVNYIFIGKQGRTCRKSSVTFHRLMCTEMSLSCSEGFSALTHRSFQRDAVRRHINSRSGVTDQVWFLEAFLTANSHEAETSILAKDSSDRD